MGMIGELFALAGLHVDKASFAEYSAGLAAVGKETQTASSGMQALMAGTLAAPALIVGAAGAAGLSIASGFQDAIATMKVLYGDLDVAKEKFTWLADFAAKTPFEFPELLDATVKLKAYGIDAQKYMGILGDTAAGMGKDIGMAVEALADAQTGDFERLKEFGIKAVEITSKNYQQLGVDVANVGRTAMTAVDASGKQIVEVVDRNNREMITSTVTAIWNDQYAGAMESRAQTLSGMWSTLKDSMSFILSGAVGFSIEDVEVRSFSLMGVLQELMEVGISLMDIINSAPESFLVLVSVLAAVFAGASLVAAGLTAMALVTPILQIEIAALGMTLSAALWQLTLIALGVAVVVTALWEFNERTGLLTLAWEELGKAWKLAEDILTIVWDKMKTAYNDMRTVVGEIIDFVLERWNALIEAFDIDIPTSLTDFWTGIREAIATEADEIDLKNAEIAKSTEENAVKVVEANKSSAKSYDDLDIQAGTSKTGIVEKNGLIATSATDMGKAYTKALADIKTEMENIIKMDLEGITTTSSISDKIAPGKEGLEVSAGQNSKGAIYTDAETGEKTLTLYTRVGNEIVKTTEKLKDMKAGEQETFSLGDRLLHVIAVDTATNNELLEKQLINWQEQGDAVLTVDVTAKKATYSAHEFSKSMHLVAGLNLDNVIDQIWEADHGIVVTNGGVDMLNRQLVTMDAKTLANIRNETLTVGSAIDANYRGNNSFIDSLEEANGVSQADQQNSQKKTGEGLDLNSIKSGTYLNWLTDINKAPQTEQQASQEGIGSRLDDNSSKSGTLLDWLNGVDSAPMTTATSSQSDLGSSVDNSTLSASLLAAGLGIVNMSPLGIIIGAVGSIGGAADTAGGRVSTLNSLINGLNSISLDTIWQKLASVWDYAEKVAAKVTSALSADSGSSGGGGGGARAPATPGIEKAPGSGGTGESNVKIVNQTNNYGIPGKGNKNQTGLA